MQLTLTEIWRSYGCNRLVIGHSMGEVAATVARRDSGRVLRVTATAVDGARVRARAALPGLDAAATSNRGYPQVTVGITPQLAAADRDRRADQVNRW